LEVAQRAIGLVRKSERKSGLSRKTKVA